MTQTGICASTQALGYTREMWDRNKGPTSLPPLSFFPPPLFFFQKKNAQASALALGYTPEMWDNNKGPTSLPPLPAPPQSVYNQPFKREPKP